MKELKNVLFIIFLSFSIIGFIILCWSAVNSNVILRLPLIGIVLIIPLVINACCDVKEIAEENDNEEELKSITQENKTEAEAKIEEGLKKIKIISEETVEKIKNWDWD